MTAPVRTLVATPLTEVTMSRARWLWHHRYKLRALGLLAGPEGVGKSMITCWIIAAVTRGALEGELKGEPRNVIVAATEDDFSDTIKPRLAAAGADMCRVFRTDVTEGDFGNVQLSFPNDIEALRVKVWELEAALLVLDPIISRLSGKLDTHKDSDVRKALEPLTALAQDTGLTIVGIIHVNKSGTGNPLDAIMGSKAFSAVVRSVGMVVEDEDGVRLLTFPKNNNAPKQPSLIYEIATVQVGSDPDDQSPIEAPYIVWTGTRDRSAQDVYSDRLEKATGGRHRNPDSMTARAETLLRTLLAAGPMPQKQVEAAAVAAGISTGTLSKAKQKVGVVSSKPGLDPWVWSLPLSPEPTPQPPSPPTSHPPLPLGDHQSPLPEGHPESPSPTSGDHSESPLFASEGGLGVKMEDSPVTPGIPSYLSTPSTLSTLGNGRNWGLKVEKMEKEETWNGRGIFPSTPPPPVRVDPSPADAEDSDWEEEEVEGAYTSAELENMRAQEAEAELWESGTMTEGVAE